LPPLVRAPGKDVELGRKRELGSPLEILPVNSTACAESFPPQDSWGFSREPSPMELSYGF